MSEGALSGQYPVGSTPLSGLFPMYEYGLIDWLFAGFEIMGRRSGTSPVCSRIPGRSCG